ncbi:MAG: hypothetical protein AAGI66_04315 [Cyanobacteria bacterium P01_H01_bin.74]
MSNLSKPTAKKSSKRKPLSVERLMTMFTLYFFTGVLIVLLIPSGSPAKAIAMTLYALLVFWSMFRFGL